MKNFTKIFLMGFLLLFTSLTFAADLPKGKPVSHVVSKLNGSGWLYVITNIYDIGSSGNSNSYFSENYQIVTFLSEDPSDNINNRVTLSPTFSFTMTASATATNYINPATNQGMETLGVFPFSATIQGGTSYYSQVVEGPSNAGGNSLWLSFSNISLSSTTYEGLTIGAYANANTWYGYSPIPH